SPERTSNDARLDGYAARRPLSDPRRTRVESLVRADAHGTAGRHHSGHLQRGFPDGAGGRGIGHGNLFDADKDFWKMGTGWLWRFRLSPAAQSRSPNHFRLGWNFRDDQV